MKKKVVLMTAFGIIILIAVAAAALNALFTVTKVDVAFTTYSAEGKSDAVSLQARLDGFLGRSSAFLDLNEVEQTVKEYPGFEITAIEKSYPQTVKLSVSERKEAFAFQKENGTYAIFDSNCVYLYDKEENVSRVGGENILLEGFSFRPDVAGMPVSGAKVEEVKAFYRAFQETLGSVRANIISISLRSHFMTGEYLRVQTREGVFFDIYTPENQAEAKAKAALDAYIALPYEEKLYGCFDVIDVGADGERFTVGRHLEAPFEE